MSPLADANNSALIGLVERMLELNKKKNSANVARFELLRLEREITETDAEIDDLVFELYSITHKERQLIQEMPAKA